MNKEKYTIILLVLILLIFIRYSGKAYADNPTVKISLNKNILFFTDTLNITIVIKGFDLPLITPPKWPHINGMTLVDSRKSVLRTVVGGKTFSRYTFLGSYIPEKSGITIVPSIVIDVPGLKFKSQPIKLKILNPDHTENTKLISPPTRKTVSSGMERPSEIQKTDQIKIITDISNKTPYIGEGIFLTYKILTNISIGQKVIEVKRPQLNHFWIENATLELEPPFSSFFLKGMRFYQILLRRFVLFPLHSGKLIIDSSSWKITAKYEKPKYHEVEKILTTKQQEIFVKPLPIYHGEPTRNIQVGTYIIRLNHPNTFIKLGQTCPLYLILKGTGNIKALIPPPLPTNPDFNVISIRTVHTKCQTYIDESNGQPTFRYGGEKVWEIVIFPKRDGMLKFQPIRFTFFNPLKENYETVFTKPIAFTVKAVKNEPATLNQLPLLHKKFSTKSFIIRIIFFILLFALICMTITAIWLKKRKLRIHNKDGRKISVNELLNEAGTLVTHSGSKAFYDLIIGALTLGLYEVLGMSVQSMTVDEIADIMRRKEIPEKYIEKVRKVFDKCNEARFAGKSFNVSERKLLLKTVRDIYRLKDSNLIGE